MRVALEKLSKLDARTSGYEVLTYLIPRQIGINVALENLKLS